MVTLSLVISLIIYYEVQEGKEEEVKQKLENFVARNQQKILQQVIK
jgi:hypothetical protein